MILSGACIEYANRKPHFYLSRGYWCVEFNYMNAQADSMVEAWALWLRMKEKRETGYVSSPDSSLQFSAI